MTLFSIHNSIAQLPALWRPALFPIFLVGLLANLLANPLTNPLTNPLANRWATLLIALTLFFPFTSPRADTGAAIGTSDISNNSNLETLRKIDKYLNQTKTMQAAFTQVGPQGEFSEGVLYLRRPGRLRFDYALPEPLLIVADGTWLIMHDRELGQVTRWPIADTPLNLLVKKDVNLAQDAEIISITHLGSPDDPQILVRLRDRGRPDIGLLTITFQKDPIRLLKWEIIDARGLTTRITLYQPHENMKLAPELFRFRDPQPFRLKSHRPKAEIEDQRPK